MTTYQKIKVMEAKMNKRLGEDTISYGLKSVKPSFGKEKFLKLAKELKGTTCNE